MKRLLIITLLLASAAIVSAGTQYYGYPDATKFYDSDRMLVYQSNSGSKNLTGSGLKNIIKKVTARPEYPIVFQAVTSSTIPFQTVSMVRNRNGVIQRIDWESGRYFQGTPGYNHTYVYPFNGMTNVRRTTPLVVGSYWLTRGVVGQGITLQGVALPPIQALGYIGKIGSLPYFDFIAYNQANQTQVDAWFWGVSSVGTLAANTTYTIRSEMPRRWGATVQMYSLGANPCTYALANTSSAKVMTNYSSVLCRSTFRTGSI